MGRSIVQLFKYLAVITILPVTVNAEWSEPINISGDIRPCDNRSVASGCSLFVAATYFDPNMIFLMSPDNGRSWTAPISPAPRFISTSLLDIAVIGGLVHIVFASGMNVYHVSSPDGGLTWSNPTTVSTHIYAWYPKIAGSGDTLYVIALCQTQRMYIPLLCKRSLDGGVTWQDETFVEDSGAVMWIPEITYSMGRVHIIYEYSNIADSVRFEICYRFSDNYGLTWSDRQYLSTVEFMPNDFISRDPEVCTDGNGKLLVVWTDQKYGFEDVITRVSLNNGIDWLPEVCLTDSQFTEHPTCCIVDKRLNVAWSNSSPPGDHIQKITYSTSFGHGQEWSPPQVISGDSGRHEIWPNLVFTYTDHLTLHCIMTREIDINGNNGRLYYFYNDELTGVDEAIAFQDDYQLNSFSYPNPFNPIVTIHYNLPNMTSVNLDVFDVLGRKIESLVDTKQEAGYHRVQWDAHNFPSGSYFYRIQSDGFSESGKMLLLK